MFPKLFLFPSLLSTRVVCCLRASVRLYVPVKHARGSKSGHVLRDGVLNFRVTKTYQADLVGLSKVTVGEPKMCGRLRADCIR